MAAINKKNQSGGSLAPTVTSILVSGVGLDAGENGYLLEDEQTRMNRQVKCNRAAPALPTGQAVATLAEHGVLTLGQLDRLNLC